MGAAVNSRSQSDYGWDAHVHTPEDVLDMGNLPKSWKMSGLSAHVQVKNAQSGSAASVKVGSLRAWIAGSKIGTPTFYFFIDRDSRRRCPIRPKINNQPLCLRAFRADFNNRWHLFSACKLTIRVLRAAPSRQVA
jgi:hypothetical protein